MSFPERSDYVRYRLEKSAESSDAAQSLMESQLRNVAVSRFYYAVFYAANALLVKNKLEAKTHSGIKNHFFLNYVKTGSVSAELGKVYSDLFDWRHKGDYADFFDFTEDDVPARIIPTNELIKAIRAEIDKIEIL